jgi:hypothetical protein
MSAKIRSSFKGWYGNATPHLPTSFRLSCAEVAARPWVLSTAAWAIESVAAAFVQRSLCCIRRHGGQIDALFDLTGVGRSTAKILSSMRGRSLIALREAAPRRDLRLRAESRRQRS